MNNLASGTFVKNETEINNLLTRLDELLFLLEDRQAYLKNAISFVSVPSNVEEKASVAPEPIRCELGQILSRQLNRLDKCAEEAARMKDNLRI